MGWRDGRKKWEGTSGRQAYTGGGKDGKVTVDFNYGIIIILIVSTSLYFSLLLSVSHFTPCISVSIATSRYAQTEDGIGMGRITPIYSSIGRGRGEERGRGEGRG